MLKSGVSRSFFAVGHRRALLSGSLALCRLGTSNARWASGIAFNTLVELQQRACAKYGERNFLGFKPRGAQGKASPQWVSYGEFGQLVKSTAAAMAQAGVSQGDKVAVWSSNRYEWAVCAYATFSLGAVYVPMYEQQRLAEVDYILRDSGAKLVLVGSESTFDKTRQLSRALPGLRDVWCFDYDFAAKMTASANAKVPRTLVSPDDLACIIYTSGSTGTPKGCLLTHKNICSNIHSMNEVMPLDSLKEGFHSVAFLPWAHCIGKNCELHNLAQRGGSVFINREITELADDLKLVKPTCLFAVPTLFKRIYMRVQDKLASESRATRLLVETALAVANRRRAVLQDGRRPSPLLELQYKVMDRMVLSKLRDPFGGRLMVAAVGGSAMDVQVADFFENCGVAILEGYGLTETAPLLTINSYDVRKRRPGSVGSPVLGAEIAIVDTEGRRVKNGNEGEIWAHGPMVFSGYCNKPEDTAVAFGSLDGKRYFRTGDLGRMVEGVLQVTGRVKELYKLENGKYVAPAVIEKALSQLDIVAQVVVLGENRPYNVALIVPNWERLRAYGLSNKLPGINEASTMEHLRDNIHIQAYVGEQVTHACKDKIKKYEVPKRWALLSEPFSVENGLLTPKMSIKRRKVLKAYAKLIEGLYRVETVRRPPPSSFSSEGNVVVSSTAVDEPKEAVLGA